MEIRKSPLLSLFLAAFGPLSFYLSNIQVSRLACDFTHPVVDTIFSQLMAKPRLHTLLVSRYTSPDAVSSLPDLTHLGHLEISLSPLHDLILEAASNLEFLVICDPRGILMHGEDFL